MELTRDPWSSENIVFKDPVIFVLTGDGNLEYDAISGFSQIFNNRKGSLLFPKRPGQTKRSGFSAVNAIKTLTSQYHYKKYLLLFDREWCQVEDPCQEIMDQIATFSYNILSFDCKLYCGNIGAHMEIEWGSHRVTLDLCIFGKTRRIEENYIDLIERQYGDKIGPEKKDLRNYLANKHIKPHELISKANHANTQGAFPFLYEIFESYPSFNNL